MRLNHEDIYLYSSSALTILRHMLWRSFLIYLVSLRSTDKHIKSETKISNSSKDKHTAQQTKTHSIQFSSNSLKQFRPEANHIIELLNNSDHNHSWHSIQFSYGSIGVHCDVTLKTKSRTHTESDSKQNLNYIISEQSSKYNQNLYCIVKAFYQMFNHFNRANRLEFLPLLHTRITVNTGFSSSLIHPYEATKTETNHEAQTNTTTNQNTKEGFRFTFRFDLISSGPEREISSASSSSRRSTHRVTERFIGES